VLEMSKKQCNKNVDFAICEIEIQSQLLNQAQIWTVDLTPYQSFEDRNMERQEKQECRNRDMRNREMI
jgi:hypothetical protein